ncbi:MAG: glycosyltransferase N-terminal domain-containing protein, partial [Pseudomonadota bacterium]
MNGEGDRAESAAAASAAQAPWPWPFALWAAVGRRAGPALRFNLARRARAGKEDAARIPERFGFASGDRPAGPLVWLHAASVGETLSALPLVERIAAGEASVVFTTGTVTAQRLLAERAPDRVAAQYAPLDQPQAAERFLAHWTPDAALFVESELWPNTLRAAATAGARLGLVTARLSPRSAARWGRAPRCAARLFGLFDVVLAQSAPDASRLQSLGAPAQSIGDLKSTARAAGGRTPLNRPVWLAASIHPEDARAFALADAAARAARPNALTILAPRHPDATESILAAMALGGRRVARLSQQAEPTASDEVFVLDRLGELPSWAAVADVAAMGGGFGQRGGHNPLEPASAGVPVVLPPDMAHFAEVADGLVAAGG